MIGWNNLVKTATITANSAAPNMGAANVAQDSGSPSVAWQTAAGVLTTAAGALIKIEWATPLSTVRAVGIFRTNLTASATVTFTAWLNNAGSPIAVDACGGTVVAGYGQALCVYPANYVCDFVQITFEDPTNPDGFINVPLAFAGPVWIPAVGVSYSSAFGRDDFTDEVTTRGGQEYPTPRWQRRWYDLRLEGIRQSEIWAQHGELDRRARLGGNVLLIPNPASVTLPQEAIFGRLRAPSSVTYPNMAGDARGWSARITERI